VSDLTSHWRKSYENKYLGAWDLWDGKRYLELAVTIDRVTRETVVMEGGRKESPILLYLSGRKGPVRTPMILSRTNGTTLEIMFGPDPKGWVQQQITLYVKQAKRVAKGTGNVLTIRSTKRSDALRDELAASVPPVDELELLPPLKERDPGEEG
jgi:hypothetical protein